MKFVNWKENGCFDESSAIKRLKDYLLTWFSFTDAFITTVTRHISHYLSVISPNLMALMHPLTNYALTVLP